MLFRNVFTDVIDPNFYICKDMDHIEVVILVGDDYYAKKNKYILMVWIASFFAAISNLSRGIFRKLFFSRDESLAEILWKMGRDEKHVSGFFIDRFSQWNHRIKVQAASSMALDILYDWNQIRKTMDNSIRSKITKFWFDNMDNRKALSNRKKVVISKLVDFIDDFINEPEVRIISIASGSARAMIEALQECRHDNVKVLLIDKDQDALDNAKNNAMNYGILDQFEFVCEKTDVLEEISERFKPHIVEMVGLVDYYDVDRTTVLASRIKDCLLINGYFITGNIQNNQERPFLDWGLLWPMVYKTPNDLKKIMLNSGFLPNKIQILYEPLKIHGISIAQK